MTARITAIVPTLAEAARHRSLARAVESLRAATERPEALEIIVVVNGNRWDPTVLTWLDTEPLEVIRIPEGSLPLAQLTGRRHVSAPFFCFLDDDDEYLPGALDLRLDVLEREPGAALVTTNGWRRIGADDHRVLSGLSGVARDPLAALFEENWLASCGALFRTEAVGVELFEDVQAFLEWTWIAFRISVSGKKVAVLDAPTYRIHDTPGSASKSPRYLASELSLFERMLAMSDRPDIQSVIRKRIQNHWSMRSVEHLRAGDVRGAWRDFRHVLGQPRPWRYASQFVRLMLASMGVKG